MDGLEWEKWSVTMEHPIFMVVSWDFMVYYMVIYVGYKRYMWGFPKMGVPQNRWFRMGNPIL